MKRYTVEVLGRVPNGLTHNDVYASLWQMVNEKTIVESSSKRSLAGRHVSVKMVFQALNENEAKATVAYATRGVTNFSCDVIGLRELP